MGPGSEDWGLSRDLEMSRNLVLRALDSCWWLWMRCRDNCCMSWNHAWPGSPGRSSVPMERFWTVKTQKSYWESEKVVEVFSDRPPLFWDKPKEISIKHKLPRVAFIVPDDESRFHIRRHLGLVLFLYGQATSKNDHFSVGSVWCEAVCVVHLHPKQMGVGAVPPGSGGLGCAEVTRGFEWLHSHLVNEQWHLLDFSCFLPSWDLQP